MSSTLHLQHEWKSGGPVLYTSTAAAEPAFDETGSWQDWPELDFPYITVPVPPDAVVEVAISGQVNNTYSDGSTSRLSWRAEGANVIEDQIRYAVTKGARGLLAATKVVKLTGLASGVTRFIPQWYISSGNASTASCKFAYLQIEVRQ